MHVLSIHGVLLTGARTFAPYTIGSVQPDNHLTDCYYGIPISQVFAKGLWNGWGQILT